MSSFTVPRVDWGHSALQVDSVYLWKLERCPLFPTLFVVEGGGEQADPWAFLLSSDRWFTSCTFCTYRFSSPIQPLWCVTMWAKDSLLHKGPEHWAGSLPLKPQQNCSSFPKPIWNCLLEKSSNKLTDKQRTASLSYTPWGWLSFQFLKTIQCCLLTLHFFFFSGVSFSFFIIEELKVAKII